MIVSVHAERYNCSVLTPIDQHVLVFSSGILRQSVSQRPGLSTISGHADYSRAEESFFLPDNRRNTVLGIQFAVQSQRTALRNRGVTQRSLKQSGQT